MSSMECLMVYNRRWYRFIRLQSKIKLRESFFSYALFFLVEKLMASHLFVHHAGALHIARWMAKTIHSIKICLFRDQIKLTAHELQGLMKVSLLFSLIYARFWHEAPLAQRAPLNDQKLLKLLDEYPEHFVKDKANAALKRHLWYFSEHLVPLALFDVNFSRAPNKIVVKRLEKKTFDHNSPVSEYITSRSMLFFDLLSKKWARES